MHKLGHQPCVFALDKDGKGFHRSVNFQTRAVPASPYEGDTDGLIKQRISEFVLFFEKFSQPFDIYHAQDCLSANALALLREKGDIPHFVRTVHHIESFRSPYLQACQEKSIYQPDRCLCVSEVWQRVLKAEYGIEAHRVINGVSDRFSSHPDGLEDRVAETYGITGQPVYLTVGGIEPRKNSIRLLQAFRQVLDPKEVEAIAAGMLSMTQADSPLRQRRDAIARRYRWTTSAQMHLDLYQQLEIDG